MSILEHPAVTYCLCWDKLLADVVKKDQIKPIDFEIFCGRINRFADKIGTISLGTNNSFWHESGEDAANKFKGDVFEVFGELLIRLSPLDDRIGIHNYHPVFKDDTGVDGHGIGLDGSPVTVQFKFRPWDYIVTDMQEHLANFRLTSYQKFGVSPTADGKMYIITAGKEVFWRDLSKTFLGKIRCISRKASYGCLRGAQRHTIDSLFSLDTITDNRFFWEAFKEQVGVK